MSLPPFNQRGVLPKGLHRCTPKEFIERFCYEAQESEPWIESTVRHSYAEVLEQIFGHFIERGAKSLIFGGSFITNEEYPNDIDCIVILPNEKCLPQKSEIVIMCDCKLDLVYAFENDKEFVSRMINMFSKDRYELDVGLVEVILDSSFESTWNYFYGDCDFDELLKERSAYIQRHLIVGSEKRGLFITIHGLNTNAEWNFELAPIASANNWIFAPYNYGNVTIPLITEKGKKDILNDFRDWLKNISDKYKMKPSIFAHSFGTYILGEYIKGFNFEPPVKFNNIILAGSILTPDYNWIAGFENNCYNAVLNFVSPNDPWVPRISPVKWLVATDLYGTAGTTGFSQEHPRLFYDEVDIYDHCNMLKIDVFETKVIPFLNMSRGFECLSWRFASDKAWEKMTKG